MIHYTKFYPEHLRYIAGSSVQHEDAAFLMTPEAAAAVQKALGFTAWRGGDVLGAGGIVDHWRGRAEAWVLLTRAARPFIRPLVRRMLVELDKYPARRVEMTVRIGNDAGHRLARLLGFADEARLEAYTPEGQDVVLYKRVREWQR